MFQRFPLFLASLVMLRKIIWLEWFRRINIYTIFQHKLLTVLYSTVQLLLALHLLSFCCIPGKFLIGFSFLLLLRNYFSVSLKVFLPTGHSSFSCLFLFPLQLKMTEMVYSKENLSMSMNCQYANTASGWSYIARIWWCRILIMGRELRLFYSALQVARVHFKGCFFSVAANLIVVHR